MPGSVLCTAGSRTGDEPEAIRDVLERQAAAWAGGQSVEVLLEALERARVPNFVREARMLFVP